MDRHLPSFKHMKPYAKAENSQCKHPYRILPSPSWIMVTNLDLGNEFLFWYLMYTSGFFRRNIVVEWHSSRSFKHMHIGRFSVGEIDAIKT